MSRTIESVFTRMLKPMFSISVCLTFIIFSNFAGYIKLKSFCKLGSLPMYCSWMQRVEYSFYLFIYYYHSLPSLFVIIVIGDCKHFTVVLVEVTYSGIMYWSSHYWLWP